MTDITDVAIIGAGPAGLQAALTIGRMHRTAIVFDTGVYRNDAADAMHNLITHDGDAPANLREDARQELARYDTVRLVEARVQRVSGETGRFTLTTDDDTYVTARVILATGMRDTLPTIPGIESVFGSTVAHCPFCHGHEFAGTPVALIGPAPFIEHMSVLMSPIASSITAFPSAGSLDAGIAARLERMGVAVDDRPVHGFHGRADGVDLVVDDGAPAHGKRNHGSLIPFGGALVKIDSAPAAPHAEQLGVERSDIGAVLVDPFGRTSVDGVYAAGDIAQPRNMGAPMWSVWSAIASGGTAGTGAMHDITTDERRKLWGSPEPSSAAL